MYSSSTAGCFRRNTIGFFFAHTFSPFKDFIFAVFSEEFGFVGNVILVTLYFLLILRCLVIAANAPTLFSRLMAGAVTMIFFTYAFVNMGMVIGIVPVVGVPLPFMSYGGTALVTLGMGLGIMMSVQRNRKLVQT